MLTGGSSPDLLCNVPGQSVGEKPEGTRASSHSFGYICSALRREGLAAEELILKASTFLRSLNLFLELRSWTVPRSLAADQPGRSGEQGTDGPELSEFHPSTHRPGGQAKRGDRLALQNFVRGLVYESVNGHAIQKMTGQLRGGRRRKTLCQ
jgi:hypothetical protein